MKLTKTMKCRLKLLLLTTRVLGMPLTDKIISNTANKATQSVHDVKSQDNDLKTEELAVKSTAKVCENRNERLNGFKVCCCNCTCGSNVTKAELEGIKLDMAVLESRLVSASPLEEINLEIKTLKTNQNDMEVVIRRQDELICKINDENMVLKSKLFSMEFLMHEEVIHNRHSDGNSSPQGSLHVVNPSNNTHSDGNNSPQGSLHAVNPSDKSHDCEQLINVKLTTLTLSI
jgi:hypothetical protein